MLSRFFEDSVSLQADEHGEFRVDSLPDGRTRIGLLMAGDHFCTGLWVIGPRTKAYFKRTRDIERMLLATIKPGWASTLLDIPATDFTDRTVMLKTLWGESAMALTRVMLASPDAAALPERFTTVALERKRARVESSSARLARHAVRMLDAEALPVGHVAARLGVTARHLRRTFIENVGVGVKEFARASRLQRALRLAKHGGDWGEVATHAGYFDQSHFSADFKALMGVTPTAFLTHQVEDNSCGF